MVRTARVVPSSNSSLGIKLQVNRGQDYFEQKHHGIEYSKQSLYRNYLQKSWCSLPSDPWCR